MELFARLSQHAVRAPSAIAAREVGVGCSAAVTYGALWERVGAVSDALRGRVEPGQVVILVTGNRVEYFVACLAVWAAGCVVMPMHPSVAETELAGAARRTGARLVVRDSRHVSGEIEGCEGVPVIELCDLVWNAGDAGVQRGRVLAESGRAGLLLQSSGTTGLPKIARRSADAVDAVARNVADAAGLRGKDRVFGAVPICHAYGIENGFLAPLWAGSTVHLCDGLDVPVAMAQFAGDCSVFPGVPFMFEVLSKTEGLRGRCSLRLAYSAGGMLPPAVAHAFEERFGRRVGQLYGASELGSVTFNHPDQPAADPLSVGQPMQGVDIRVLDPGREDPGHPLASGLEGLVAIKAPSMMSGYVGDGADEHESVSLVNGYFLTGDLGRVSPAGDLVITGRLKNLIDIGGMKVNPAEVEVVLKEHPSIAECVVVPMPVTPTVSRLRAFVVPSNGGVDTEELRRFARGRLPGYKVPRLIEVRETLPRSASGKILRSQLEAAE